MIRPDVSSTAKRLRALAGIAGVEMLVRGVGGVSLVDVLQPVSEWLILGLSVGLSQGLAGQALGELSMWTLYAYGVYAFLPGLFPDWLSDLGDDRLFVGLVVLGAVVMAQPLVGMLGGTRQAVIAGSTTRSSSDLSLSLILLLLAVWIGVFGVYFRFVRGETVYDESSPLHRLIQQFDHDDETVELLNVPSSERSVTETVDVWLTRIVPGLLFTFVSLLLGMMMAILVQFYPVPELLFVVTAVAAPIVSRTAWFDDATDVDLDRVFGTSVFTILRGKKGTATAAVTAVGVGVSAPIFFVGLFVVGRAVAQLRTAFLTVADGGSAALLSPAVQRASATVGAASTLCASAVLLLWVWFRLARRSPSFSIAWRHRWDETDEEPPEATLSRPVGGTALPVALASVASPFVVEANELTPLVTASSLLWPVGLLVAALWVRHALRRDPQPPLGDNLVYLLSITLELSWLLVFGTVRETLSDSGRQVVLALILFVGLFYVTPDVEKRLERFAEPWSLLANGTVALVSIPILALALLAPDSSVIASDFSVIFGVVAIFAIVGAAISVARGYQSRTE